MTRENRNDLVSLGGRWFLDPAPLLMGARAVRFRCMGESSTYIFNFLIAQRFCFSSYEQTAQIVRIFLSLSNSFISGIFHYFFYLGRGYPPPLKHEFSRKSDFFNVFFNHDFSENICLSGGG